MFFYLLVPNMICTSFFRSSEVIQEFEKDSPEMNIMCDVMLWCVHCVLS